MWRVILAIIFTTGIYATYVRFFEGFRASTNLSDRMPWGLWVGLGTLCGIGLSAAGFGISAAVYLLGMERYRPILRASILISFLGYLTVCVGYLYEIGLPWRFWHPIVMWNHTSVLFDVCVCIMTYTTVLTFEFAPAVIEKLPWKPFPQHDTALPSQDPGRRSADGRAAVIDASVVSRRAVPDRSRQSASAVVLALHARPVLSVGHSRRSGV